MADICTSYAAADAAGRHDLLLELIRTHHFDPSLIQLIAQESPEFVAAIAIPLWQIYPYFFNNLLCQIVDHQGIQQVTTVLQKSNFTNYTMPLDLARIGVYRSTYSNPLSGLYHHCGPQSFIALYESQVVSLRQLYLWVRSQSLPDNNLLNEQFILALTEYYYRDFAKALSALAECFIAECDIATAQGEVYYLKDHLPLLDQLLSQLGIDGFCDFLSYLGAKLRRRPAHEMAENIIYCEFLKYFSLTHTHIDNQQLICPQFWIWLLGHATELSDIRDFLLLFAKSDCSHQ